MQSGKLSLATFALLAFASLSGAGAQVMQMPPTEMGPPAVFGGACAPGMYAPGVCAGVDPAAVCPPPDMPVEPLPPVEDDGVAAPSSDLSREARPGVFQRLAFVGTWLPRGGDRGLGISDMEISTVLGFPFPTRESPLLVTPGFAVHYVDGPADVGLPPRLFDAYAEFRWLRRLTPQLGIDAAVTPGVYSDFRQSDSQALRITGHVVAAWTCTPTLDLVLGGTYLDRPDVPFLPVCGLTWTPNPDVKFDLVFPKPKISRRVYFCGACGADVQDWVYIGGELGGGTWAIERADGGGDVYCYRDIRVFLGVERKAFPMVRPLFEVGYVFARKITLDQAGPDVVPPNTLMLRGGLTY